MSGARPAASAGTASRWRTPAGSVGQGAACCRGQLWCSGQRVAGGSMAGDNALQRAVLQCGSMAVGSAAGSACRDALDCMRPAPPLQCSEAAAPRKVRNREENRCQRFAVSTGTRLDRLDGAGAAHRLGATDELGAGHLGGGSGLDLGAANLQQDQTSVHCVGRGRPALPDAQQCARQCAGHASWAGTGHSCASATHTCLPRS